MLHDQHIRIDTGRAVGGDFMRITHVPTGITRSMGPPLGSGKEAYGKRRQMLQEIEEELAARGLTEFIWQPDEKKRRRDKVVLLMQHPPLRSGCRTADHHVEHQELKGEHGSKRNHVVKWQRGVRSRSINPCVCRDNCAMAGLMHHANKIALENEKRRSRPFVVFDMEPRHSCMHALLRNIGMSPARNVRVTTQPEIAGLIGGQSRETTLTAHAISLLAPGREISDFVDGNPQFYKAYPTPVFSGTIEYDDFSGQHFREDFTIDLTFRKEHMSVTEKDVAREVEELRRSLERLLSHHTPELVRVINEDQYREEVEEDLGIQLRPKKGAMEVQQPDGEGLGTASAPPSPSS